MAIKIINTSGNIGCGSAGSLTDIANGALSISAWVFPNSRGGGNGGIIVGKGDANNTGWAFGEDTAVVDGLRFGIAGNVANLAVETVASALSNGVWQHVVLTTDSTQTVTGSNIFVNTVSKKDGAAGAPASGGKGSDSNVSLYIGGRLLNDRVWDGSITELAIWKGVLSTSDIARLYGSGTPNKRMPVSVNLGNLIGYWPLNEDASGTVNSANGYVKDLSSNTNNGTQSNNPAYVAEPSFGMATLARVDTVNNVKTINTLLNVVFQ